MNIGDRVRVATSVVIYHHPEHRGQPFDLQGSEGEVMGFANEWHGKAISANLPIQVKFGPKLKVHLREQELEAVG
ncbi:MAG: ferredoxin-thioredoxin reductase variable chain [Cyanobacteria bacterium P01_H01_bin.121]